MKDKSSIESELIAKGHRITAVRQALIDIFRERECPLSVSEILTALKKRRLNPNKTTVYRELEFMKKENMVLEIQFSEDKKRYESAYGNHHHHLVCMKCESIQDVVLDKELEEEEQKIARQKQFKVLNHSLEFFGLCAQCQ